MRIAAVVPRYGNRVASPAGGWPQLVCERLAAHAEVEVLSTCARDESTWADFYAPGPDRVGPVAVHRFRVDYPRSPALAERLERAAFSTGATADPELERRWLEETGPWSSSLLRFLERAAGEYDAVLFFTYWSATSVHGLRLPGVAPRAVLVPTARDEPRLRLGVFRPSFAAAGGLVCATAAERDLVLDRFRPIAPHAVVGAAGSSAEGERSSDGPGKLERAFLEIATRVAATARSQA